MDNLQITRFYLFNEFLNNTLHFKTSTNRLYVFDEI